MSCLNHEDTKTRSKYKAYPRYKDSGIKWLGQIPEDWNIKKVKHIFAIGRGRVISQEELLINGTFPVYSSQTKNNGVLGYINTYDFEGQQVTWTTDGANAGTVFLRDGKYNCTNVCGTLKPIKNSVDLRFSTFFLSIATEFYKRPDTNGAKIMNNEMAEIILISPHLKEQISIANFLDQETGKMDLLIEKQQTMIALLKEKRQAVISHAVTKGLNPNAPMKDSGIKWLGQIPEHWNIKRLKFNFELQSEKVEIDGQPIIALENIESGSGKFIPTDSNYTGQDVAFKQGDILFGKLRPYLAKVFECKESGVGFGDILVYRPKRHINSSFGFYSLINDTFIRVVDSSTYGTKMPRASSEFIGEIYLPTPPKSEQKEIASYLKKQTQKIDTLIEKSQQAIALLKERKTALISAAVTGKIDVRGVA